MKHTSNVLRLNALLSDMLEAHLFKNTNNSEAAVRTVPVESRNNINICFNKLFTSTI